MERRYRERMFSFNQAKIAYHTKDFNAAIPLLQRANCHDLLLNLGARTLLLKIYYELDEFDLLQSHLDTFSSYLRRKDGLGYHRTNYRNLIRYTNRLLGLNFLDKGAAGFSGACAWGGDFDGEGVVIGANLTESNFVADVPFSPGVIGSVFYLRTVSKYLLVGLPQ